MVSVQGKKTERIGLGPSKLPVFTIECVSGALVNIFYSNVSDHCQRNISVQVCSLPTHICVLLCAPRFMLVYLYFILLWTF